MKNAEDVQELWGWSEDRFSAPLPPTARFPRREINAGSFGRLLMPPYISATRIARRSGQPDLMLCRSDGWRAGIEGEDDRNASLPGDTTNCLYADQPECLPPEWRGPVERAVAEVRKRWPDVMLRPPPPDTDPRTIPR